jgi:hypothetical protein
MVGMRMGNDRPVDRFAGIDVENTIPAVKSGFGICDHEFVLMASYMVQLWSAAPFLSSSPLAKGSRRIWKSTPTRNANT